ncbi:MAG: DUF3368 domain-containing protein, partial [Acidobacteriota bacterium]
MVVCNSSPLIYLAALDDFHLLHTLFGEITIPQAVFEEVVVAGASFPVARSVEKANHEWLHVRQVIDSTKTTDLLAIGLDPGESEALALAVEIRAETLLL